jgi:hypothetical protein
MSFLTCIFLISMLVTSKVMAQLKDDRPANPLPKQMMQVNTVGNYSYRLLPASNNSFGYDIYQNKKLVFHAPAVTFMASNGERYFPGIEQTQKIVLVAVEKIKKGKLPILTNEEIKRIAQ